MMQQYLRNLPETHWGISKCKSSAQYKSFISQPFPYKNYLFLWAISSHRFLIDRAVQSSASNRSWFFARATTSPSSADLREYAQAEYITNVFIGVPILTGCNGYFADVCCRCCGKATQGNSRCKAKQSSAVAWTVLWTQTLNKVLYSVHIYCALGTISVFTLHRFTCSVCPKHNSARSLNFQWQCSCNCFPGCTSIQEAKTQGLCRLAKLPKHTLNNRIRWSHTLPAFIHITSEYLPKQNLLFRIQ